MSLESGHFGYWIYKYKIGKNLTLMGHSRGANRTCLIVPELGLYLDAGVQHGMRAEAVFLTHGHSDHSHALNMICSDFNMSEDKDDHRTAVYCPKKLAPFILENRHSFNSLRACTSFKWSQDEFDFNVFGMTKDDNRTIQLKNRDYYLEIFDCDHGVPCIGYGLSEVKQKLKDEYLDPLTGRPKISGKEIVALKNEGVEITHTVHEKMFVFLGDTTTKVFTNFPAILTYPTVIVECNYYDDEHLDKAAEKKHVHWKYLKPIVKDNPNTKFILIHFSLQYKMENILEFFEKEMEDENIQNIHIWQNGHVFNEMLK